MLPLLRVLSARPDLAQTMTSIALSYAGVEAEACSDGFVDFSHGGEGGEGYDICTMVTAADREFIDQRLSSVGAGYPRRTSRPTSGLTLS